MSTSPLPPSDTTTDSGIKILPPHTIREVTIDGYLVPHVHAGEAEDGKVHVFVDGRYGVIAESRAEFDKWIWLLANAMAISAGYSSHGFNCKPINPFHVKCTSIDLPKPRPKLEIVINPSSEPGTISCTVNHPKGWPCDICEAPLP